MSLNASKCYNKTPLLKYVDRSFPNKKITYVINLTILAGNCTGESSCQVYLMLTLLCSVTFEVYGTAQHFWNKIINIITKRKHIFLMIANY
jgi:hypothetical protein